MPSVFDVGLPLQPRTPPFLFTYWNPLSENADLVQNWFDYVKDASVAKYTADTVGLYLAQTSEDQINALESTGRRICGALFQGFSKLENQQRLMSGQLDVISGQLTGISSVLQSVNQRLDLILDEARTSNLLLENIAELLRIPDSQKQRQRHIEMALKFLKNASRDEDLYQDALHELLEAEKIEKSDYFVLHRIGMIYLYAPALGNLEKAVEYFAKAGKYAVVETHPEAARLSNVLNKAVSKRFSEQAEPSAADISAHAADSYFQAATALYALARFEEAEKMAEKAVNCQPSEAKYHFFWAKYLTRSGNADAAVERMLKAAEIEPAMAVMAVGDFDLNQSKPVLELLDALNNAADSKLEKGIRRLKKWSEVNQHTRATRWIENAVESLQTGSYPQKQSLLPTLAGCDRMVSQLDKITALGFKFDLEKAGNLILEKDLEGIQKKWRARRYTHYIIDPQLAETETSARGFEGDDLTVPVLLVTAGDCYFVKSGALKWEADADTLPAIAGDKVFVGLKNSLVALDRSTGTMLWNFDAKSPVENPIIGDWIVFFGSKAGTFAVDSRTGRKLWEREVSSRSLRLSGDGKVFIFADGVIHAVEGATGELLWNFKTPDWKNPHVVVANEAVFAGAGGTIIALNVQTGSTLWSSKIKSAERRYWADVNDIPIFNPYRIGLRSLTISQEWGDVLVCTFESSVWDDIDEEYGTHDQEPHNFDYFLEVVGINSKTGKELWAKTHRRSKDVETYRSNAIITSSGLYAACGSAMVHVAPTENNWQDCRIERIQASGQHVTWSSDIVGLATNGLASIYLVGQSERGRCLYSLEENIDEGSFELLCHAVFPTTEKLSESCPLVVDDEGMIYVKHGNKVLSVYSTDEQSVNAHWPMHRQNQQGTSCAVLPHFPEKTSEQLALEAEARQCAEAKAQREQEIAERDREIASVLSEARAAEAAENSKWLRKKDFSRARQLYARAAALGSKEAAEAIQRLPP